MKSYSKTLAIISSVFVNTVWGLSFIVSKYALANGLGPFAMIMLRYVIAPIGLLPAMLLSGKGIRFPKEHWFFLILSALFGVTLYFFFESSALQYTSASNASFIAAAIPVMTMLSGVIFHHKKPSLLNWMGTILSLFGVYLVVAVNQEGESSLIGNAFMLIAGLCWVGYIEFTDILLKHYNSLEITFWQSIFSLLTLLPFGLSEGTNWAAIPTGVYWSVCGFLGLICSALSFMLYAYSIDILSPVQSAIFININPLVAALGSVILLNERLYPAQIIGGIIIIVSVFFVNCQIPMKKHIDTKPL